MQKHVIKSFAPLQRSCDKNAQVVGNALLPPEVRKSQRAKLLFELRITGKSDLFSQVELLLHLPVTLNVLRCFQAGLRAHR